MMQKQANIIYTSSQKTRQQKLDSYWVMNRTQRLAILLPWNSIFVLKRIPSAANAPVPMH